MQNSLEYSEPRLIRELKDAGLEEYVPKHMRRTIYGGYEDAYTEPEEIAEADKKDEAEKSYSNPKDAYWASDDDDGWNEEDDDYDDNDKYSINNDPYEPEITEDDIHWDDDEGAPQEEEPAIDRDPTHVYHGQWFERPEYVSDLKSLFNMADMEDEKFMNLRVSDIMRVTPPQLKFLGGQRDLSMMSPQEYTKLMDREEIKKRFPDVQQRVKWCVFQSVFWTEYLYMNLRPCADLITLFKQKGDIRAEKMYDNLSDKYKDEINAYIDRTILRDNLVDAISQLKEYADYLAMLTCGLYLNTTGRENQVHYVITPKKSKLHDLHRKAAADYETIASMADIKDSERIDEAIKQFTSQREYKRFEYHTDKFVVLSPINSAEIRTEGRLLSHCVGSYVDAVANGETQIYFIRRARKPDDPYYTAEVKMINHIWTLVQCYGFNDTTQKDEETRLFILEWARTKLLRIACQI